MYIQTVFKVSLSTFISRLPQAILRAEQYDKARLLLSATEVQQGESIQLFTKLSPDGQVDSVVPLRWCISRETAETLKEKKITKPYMLIVISNGQEEVDRYLTPLTAEMQYIRFRKPGKNTVHATIVARGGGGGDVRKSIQDQKGSLLYWQQPRVEALRVQYNQLHRERVNNASRFRSGAEGVEDMNEVYADQLQKLDDEIDSLLDTEPYAGSISVRDAWQLDQQVELDVNVPAEMFAAEPNPVLKWLGTLYFESKARDQCHLRRRAIITACTLPITAVLGLALFSIIELFNLLTAGVLLLVGMRNVSFEAILHPVENYPNEAWQNLKPSFWFFAKQEPTESWDRTRYTPRLPVFFVLSPPALVLAALLWWILPFSGLWIVAALAALVVLLILSSLIAAYMSSTSDERARKREQLEEEERQRARAALALELESLACSTKPREVSVDALPKGRRTMTLRWQETKAKVCKPFAA